MSIVKKSFMFAQSAYKWLSQSTVRSWVIFVLVAGLSLNTFNAFAQEVTDYKVDINENYQQSDTSGTALTGDSERNVDKTTEFQTLGALHTTLKAVCGIDTCFEVKDEAALSDVSPAMRKGLLGLATDNMVALLTNPPTINVVDHLAQEWVPGYDTSNSTYAAESGYDYLVAIQITDLWNMVRTVAYVLFVVILVVAGFMIMFRQKIGGQMAVTIFNTLPNVVLGLIMATFSFALVGIMIDIGAILVRVVASVLSPSGQDLISVTQPFSLYSAFTFTNVGIFSKAIGESVNSMVGLGGRVLLFFLGGVVAIVGVLVLIIVAVMVGYASIKVYVTLLKAYLGILLDTIASPLVWAFASLPGNQNMGMEWLRRVAKNILTFPLVFFFVNLGIYILSTNVSIGFPAGLTGGDISVNGTGDSFVGLAIKFFLPLVLMFMAAESPKMLEDFLPSGGGKGTAEAIKGVTGSLTKFFGGG